MTIKSTDTVFLKPVIETEVLTNVKKFKEKKSMSYDEVKMKTVKSIIHCIVVPLTHIFNRSIRTGILTERLKLAKVIPIFKSGNRKEFTNYQTVSILPQFSKFFEKLFYNKLVSFIEKQKLFSCHQYGFRKKCSPEYAVGDLVELILKFILFADDTNIFYSNENLNVLFVMNKELHTYYKVQCE